MDGRVMCRGVGSLELSSRTEILGEIAWCGRELQTQGRRDSIWLVLFLPRFLRLCFTLLGEFLSLQIISENN